MKRGLIVYLTGGAELPEGFDLLSHCREMGFTADQVELVGSRQGFYEVNDAWHYLFTKGFGDTNSWWPKRSKTVCSRFTPQSG